MQVQQQPLGRRSAGREKYVNSPRCSRCLCFSLFTIWWEKNFHTEERRFRDVCIVLLFKPPTLYAQWIYLWYLEWKMRVPCSSQIHRAKNFTCARKVHPDRFSAWAPKILFCHASSKDAAPFSSCRYWEVEVFYCLWGKAHRIELLEIGKGAKVKIKCRIVNLSLWVLY